LANSVGLQPHRAATVYNNPNAHRTCAGAIARFPGPLIMLPLLLPLSLKPAPGQGFRPLSASLVCGTVMFCLALVLGPLQAPTRAQAPAPVLPTWDQAGIADFELQECRGRKVTKADLLGQPWLAAFIFTKCAGPCPLVSSEMKKLQDATRDIPLRLVSFTVDPDRDTPEVLQFYADKLGADPDRWWFLTGDKPTIFGLVRNSFKMIVDEAENPQPGFEVIHSIEIMHVNADGVVVGRYNARNELHMARLKKVVQGKMEPGEAQRLNALPTDAAPTEVAETADTGEETQATAAGEIPRWVLRLPTTNALLNALATICLVSGYVFIKRGDQKSHGAMMLSALITSAVFLGCYLTYHFALQRYTGSSSQPYQGPPALKPLYLCILVPHILLAPVATGMALTTVWHAWRKNWAKHRRLARFTFPIWLYVSVTGVIIYLMVYHLPRAAAGG
jgi:protein SCO1/2